MKIINLKDKEGEVINLLDEYALINEKEKFLATRFLLSYNKRKYFAIVEIKNEKLFTIHDSIISDKAYLVKDNEIYLKTLLFELIKKMEKKLSERVNVGVYYLDDIREDGFLVFGGESVEYYDNKGEILSAIDVEDEIIPVKILKKGKLIVIFVSVEDFVRIFMKKFKENYKIKE